jgi:hypothetical protein
MTVPGGLLDAAAALCGRRTAGEGGVRACGGRNAAAAASVSVSTGSASVATLADMEVAESELTSLPVSGGGSKPLRAPASTACSATCQYRCSTGYTAAEVIIVSAAAYVFY